MREDIAELRKDMIAHLIATFGGDEGFADDAEVAIYWFADHYHGGQASTLYGVLCVSPFNPGPIAHLESESEIVQEMYADLVEKYS
jgi:hypothetical protein